MSNYADMLQRSFPMVRKQSAPLEKAHGACKYRKIESGFTVIELMVVAGIILILSSLLFAGLQSYRKEVAAIKCVSNLKFFGVQSSLYSADNGGEIIVYDKQGFGWQRVLSDYPGTNRTNFPKYSCPGYVEKMRQKGDVPSPLTIWFTGYCGNLYFADRSGSSGAGAHNNYQNPALRQQISSPSKTPQFFDNNAVDPNAGQAYAGYAQDGKGPWYYALWPAHKEAFNVVFFDGHVERIKYAGESTNVDTDVTKGKGAIDYPQFVWKPF